jgi:hypothetical protein
MVSFMGKKVTFSRKATGPDMNRVLTLLIIGGILFTFLAEGTVVDKNMDEFYSKEDIGLPDPITWQESEKVPVDEALAPLSGHCDENGRSDHEAQINRTSISALSAVLTWTDEAPPNPMAQNQPDSFQLTVTTPWGEEISSDTAENPQGGEGRITLDLQPPKDKRTDGTWTFTVAAGTCGDNVGPIGRFEMAADNGNDYTLEVTYTYMRSA